jgi:bifunctional DNA-binding transcriptional regulator/antitoxin component of YhaV-PrlF toxin-antitoxin module
MAIRREHAHSVSESFIGSKGRTIVPVNVRALVNAKPGTRLVWSVTPANTIIVRVERGTRNELSAKT